MLLCFVCFYMLYCVFIVIRTFRLSLNHNIIVRILQTSIFIVIHRTLACLNLEFFVNSFVHLKTMVKVWALSRFNPAYFLGAQFCLNLIFRRLYYAVINWTFYSWNPFYILQTLLIDIVQKIMCAITIFTTIIALETFLSLYLINFLWAFLRLDCAHPWLCWQVFNLYLAALSWWISI